jgi:integrase/recombinase XerD
LVIISKGDGMNVSTFLDNQRSENTRLAYRNDLAKWFEYLGTQPANVATAIGFRKHLEATTHPSTASRCFNTCRAYYRFVGGINPFQSIKSPRRVKNPTPRVPSNDLVDKMVSLCDNVRDRLVLALLNNGLRASEVADLSSDAVEWSDEYDCMIMRVVGKGFKERLVPATTEVQNALSQWTFGRKFLIEDAPGVRLTRDAITYVVQKWSARAGQEIRPHALRHGYATRLIRAGADVLSVSRLLGHESVATTQVYVALDLSTVVGAARKDPRNVTPSSAIEAVA